MMIIPSSCIAWTNEQIQKAYEDYFGTKYTSHMYGLKALIYMLSSKDTLNLHSITFYSISNMQKFLEDNYEIFRPHFLLIDKAELEYTYNKLADKHRNYDKQKFIESLGDFDKNCQRFALEKISEALRTDLKNLNFSVLKEMATEIAELLNLNLGREEKRRKSVLLKWFSTNWERIKPVVKTFTIIKF